jgi:hypothetical protein
MSTFFLENRYEKHPKDTMIVPTKVIIIAKLE